MKIFMRRSVGYFSTFPKDKLIFVSDTSTETTHQIWKAHVKILHQIVMF